MARTTSSRFLTPGLSRRGFLLAGGSAAFLTACGGGEGVGGNRETAGNFTGEYEGPAVTLDYWNGFTGGDGPTMQAMLKAFNDSQENITVKNNTMEWADFYQRLPAAANAGRGPHVGVMHLDQLATNAARQVIVPLDDVADEIGLEESDFISAVWGPGIYNDQRYGIPLDVHSLAMYYNEEHFEKAGITEPPTDAASLEDAIKALQEAGYKTPFWMPGQWPAHLMFFSLLWQNGGEPYNEDGSEALFGSEEGIAAMTWMREQVDKGYSPPNVDRDAQYLAFKNGQNSITWDGIWQINDLNAAGMAYGIAPIPTIGDQEAVWANSHHLFMTSQAADDEDLSNASKMFISEISQQSGEWAKAAMIPARNSAREDASFTDSPQAALVDQLELFHFLPSIPGVADTIAQTVEVAVNEIVLGKATPEEALTQQQSNATELLKQNQEKYGG
ncbi:ABC transporter substrate-binding protein [Nocardioides caldifontis]|uniref:ABC transporter substrate-binding protein n=1 Tax=Nocardioides caldifontis TaxID=2588938 RepID=UPI0011E0529E|nr:ABC transporter substrate-binding protein [Nocardioides caldifontis]